MQIFQQHFSESFVKNPIKKIHLIYELKHFKHKQGQQIEDEDSLAPKNDSIIIHR